LEEEVRQHLLVHVIVIKHCGGDSPVTLTDISWPLWLFGPRSQTNWSADKWCKTDSDCSHWDIIYIQRFIQLLSIHFNGLRYIYTPEYWCRPHVMFLPSRKIPCAAFQSPSLGKGNHYLISSTVAYFCLFREPYNWNHIVWILWWIEI
jgi:hypothetical protein